MWCGLFSKFLLFHIQENFIKANNRLKKYCYAVLERIIFFLLVINNGLKFFISFFIQCFFCLKLRFNLELKRLVLFLLSSSTIIILIPKINRRLILDKSDINTTSRKTYLTSLSIICHTLIASENFNPSIDNGIPAIGDREEILPSDIISLHASAHNEFTDKIFIFGDPCSFLLLMLNSAHLCNYFKKFRLITVINSLEKFSLISFFSNVLLNWMFELFRGNVYCKVFFLFSLVLPLWFPLRILK
jgi:hypothetical protein